MMRRSTWQAKAGAAWNGPKDTKMSERARRSIQVLLVGGVRRPSPPPNGKCRITCKDADRPEDGRPAEGSEFSFGGDWIVDRRERGQVLLVVEGGVVEVDGALDLDEPG